MPISFECGQCGKSYVVSDGLAGKKAQCKQCGNKMSIPGSAPSASAGSSSPTSGSNQPIPTAKRIPTAAPVSRPKPIPTSVPEAEDIYGFNEAPSSLPPLSPRGGDNGASKDDGPVKKKKKKKGFFSGGSPKQASGSSGGSSLGSKIFVGILILSAIGGGLRALTLSSKTDVKALHERVITGVNELTAQLKTVRDVPSARAASGPCNAILVKLYDDMNTNGRKKARMEDVKAVEQEIMPRLNAAGMQLANEKMRIAMIPGAPEALAIDANLERYGALGRELEAENARAGMR